MKLFKSKKEAPPKKAGKAAAENAPAKEGKKKRSGLLSDGGLNELLANHVEKALLVVALMLAIMIVFSGFGKRNGIEGNKSPDDLQQQATSAVAHVTGGSWSEFQAERDREKHFLDRATETQKNVLVEDYEMAQLIKPPLVPARTLRTDPQLLAPRDLQVITGFGALAVKPAPGSARDSGGRGNGPRRDRDAQGWREFVRTGGVNTKGVYFASVTALVPYREQLAEYKTLKNTVGYDVLRDQPHYLMWFLRRAEINGEEPLKWKIVAKSFTARRAAEEVWDGEGDEKRLDPPQRYTDELLTFKVPPLLLNDLPRYTFHKSIPRELPKPADEETDAPKRDSASDDGLFGGFDVDASPRIAPREGRGREEDNGTEGPEEVREGADESEAGERAANPPEYLMFRCFDLTVEPGKSYQYQLMLLLDDPNDPRGSGFQPPDADTLDQTVSERLHKKRTGQSKVPFGRLAPLSEPSPIAYVGNGDRMLAGKVTPAEIVTLRDQPGSFARDEPAAQVMVMTFQPTNGANVPAVKEFHRGSVGNFVENASYWPPGGEYAESVENQRFQTDLLVLDIRGGGPLQDIGVEIPGQILIFNRDGRMEVISELSDMAAFESNIVPPVEEKPEDSPRAEEGEREEKPRGRGRANRNGEVDLLNEGRGQSRGQGGRSARISHAIVVGRNEQTLTLPQRRSLRYGHLRQHGVTRETRVCAVPARLCGLVPAHLEKCGLSVWLNRVNESGGRRECRLTALARLPTPRP